MGLLTVALLSQFGLTSEFVFYFIFTAALLVVIFIDMHHQIIPDVISLSGIIFGFTGSFFIRSISWQNSGLGILIGGGILYCIALFYYIITKKDGMGGGDIKLLAMIGAFLGWQSLLFIVFASSFFGSIFGIITIIVQGKGSKTKIPFGPFLSFAALMYLFFQNDIIKLWYAYLSL
jgi:leader peptidase (prepilin peptidase)/N-methyltransferase